MANSHPVATDNLTGQLVPEREKLGLDQPRPAEKPFPEWVRALVADIVMKDRAGYNRRHKKWLTNWLFYDGRQYGFWDEERGSYEDAVPSRNSQFYINNHIAWFVDATQKEWARARTELLVRPLDDRPESKDAAKIASEILGHYQRELRGPIEHQGEGLTAAMCSVYFRYSYYSLQAGRQTTKVAQTTPAQTKLGPDSFMCGSCGEMGPKDDLIPGIIQEGNPVHEAAESPMEEGIEQQVGLPGVESSSCPYCNQAGSMSMMEAPTVTTDQVTGYDEQPMGDIVTENVDPFEIRVHPKARGGQIKTSPYIYRRRTILRSVVEAAYGLTNLPGNTDAPDEAGIRFQRNLERSAGSVTDRANAGEDVHRTRESDEEDLVLFTQIWLDSAMYAAYISPKEEKLNSGLTMPAGTTLAELFPDGLYIAMVGDKIVDCRNEDKNKHWVGGVYKLMPTSFWGRGIEDAIWQQRLLNDTYNLMVAYLKHCSSPTVLYNPHFVDGADLSGQPGEIIPVESAGSDAQLSSYYLQINPPSLPSQVPAFIEQAKKDMQSQIGAFSPIAGDPQINAETATGIKLLRESTVALIAMALQIKAKVDSDWGQQVLQLCQENWIEPHTIHIEGLYGKVEIKAFSNIDIKGKLQVTYAEHSVIPRSEIELRNDILEAMAAGGVPLGIWNPSLPHELRCLLAERFNIPYNADLYGQSERLAKIRLDNILELLGIGMQEIAQLSAQMPMQMQAPMAAPAPTGQDSQMAQGGGGDPMSGGPPTEQAPPPEQSQQQAQPQGQPGQGMMPMPSPADQMKMQLVMQVLAEVPIDALMDDHDVHMEFLKNWMHTDDGIYAPEVVKATIRQRYQEHFQAKIQMAQMQSMAMMAAQGPMMMGAGAEGGGEPPASQPPKKDKNVSPSANSYMGK